VQFAITRVAVPRGAPAVLIQNHPSVSTSTNLAAIGAKIRYAAERGSDRRPVVADVLMFSGRIARGAEMPDDGSVRLRMSLATRRCRVGKAALGRSTWQKRLEIVKGW
jgi:hypothetical protein